ncbi:unnamed protein product, partial [Ixodes persulcatus]
ISSRFPVLALRGAAVSNEVLATTAALETLLRGGNAADASVAMAAVFQVLQPYAGGVGGDCFCLFYDASKKKVHCIDGSGRSPAMLTLELLLSKGFGTSVKARSKGLLATVPGAVKCWFDTVRAFGSGKLSMADILQPAIHFAEEGFSVGIISSLEWGRRRSILTKIHGGKTFLKDGKFTPNPGDICKNISMAGLLNKIAKEGPNAVYTGPVAQSIVEAVAAAGGVMTTEDLKDHMLEPGAVPPISTTYRGTTVHTVPLPSQGAILLEALNIMEGFDLHNVRQKPGDVQHLLVEALRLAYADGLSCVSDPVTGSITEMISKEHGRKRQDVIRLDRRYHAPRNVPTIKQAGTVFTATADITGNTCAFISSNSLYFGTTIVEEHGFSVQSRGLGFNARPGHPNSAGPRKKPYHSLMPVIVTDTNSGEWMSVMGTMGGTAQPQIILQVLLNQLEFGLDPQRAIDEPRVQFGGIAEVHPNDPLNIEEEAGNEVIRGLTAKGHVMDKILRGLDKFQAGHIHAITRGDWWRHRTSDTHLHQSNSKVLWCGADSRCNGIALGY